MTFLQLAQKWHEKWKKCFKNKYVVLLFSLWGNHTTLQQYFYFYPTRNTFLYFHHVFVSVFLSTSRTKLKPQKLFSMDSHKSYYIYKKNVQPFFSFEKRYYLYIFYLLYPWPFFGQELNFSSKCVLRQNISDKTHSIYVTSFLYHRQISKFWGRLFIPTLKSLNTSSEMQSLNIYW